MNRGLTYASKERCKRKDRAAVGILLGLFVGMLIPLLREKSRFLSQRRLAGVIIPITLFPFWTSTALFDLNIVLKSSLGVSWGILGGI